MPRFHYRALRPTGGEIAGELLATDARDAAARLQAQGSYPIEITAPDSGGLPAWRLTRHARRLAPRELILFTASLPR